MFQLDETQSQGDILDFELPSDFDLAKPTTCTETPLSSEDLEKFQFLDSIIESCEKDWQDTNTDMESSEESFNLSQIMDFTLGLPSEIPVEEQSYNLSLPSETPVEEQSYNLVLSEIPMEEQSYNLNSISPSELEFWSVPESDQAILQTLMSSSTEVSFLEENALIKDAEDLNTTELSVEDTTSSVVTFSDSDSTDNLTHIAGKKYMEMRRKNNIASQRSRKIRKQKNNEMAQTLKKLEKDNKDLLVQALKLEKERDALKDKLMAILAKK